MIIQPVVKSSCPTKRKMLRPATLAVRGRQVSGDSRQGTPTSGHSGGRLTAGAAAAAASSAGFIGFDIDGSGTGAAAPPGAGCPPTWQPQRSRHGTAASRHEPSRALQHTQALQGASSTPGSPTLMMDNTVRGLNSSSATIGGGGIGRPATPASGGLHGGGGSGCNPGGDGGTGRGTRLSLQGCPQQLPGSWDDWSPPSTPERPGEMLTK